MIPWFSRFSLSFGLLVGSVAAVRLPAAEAKPEPVLGSWALTLPNGGAGWLKLESRGGWYDGSILWGGGSVLPLSSVTIEDGVATVTRVRDVQRKDAAGQVVRTQQLTETLTVRASGNSLQISRLVPSPNGRGFERTALIGKRLPPLPPAPNLAAVKWGAPVTLFNGYDLSGWKLKEPELENGWTVEKGVLSNRPAPKVAGQPPRKFGNLRTEKEFEDFQISFEVNVPEGSNSGVYLRGIYEIQIFDSYGKPLDAHNMGAVYSRITPTVAAEKPAGQWQSVVATLVDRHITVVLNGKTIIDNQPVEGCTGGALWSDPFRPGPLYLQGDHGPVSYRNLVLRPAIK